MKRTHTINSPHYARYLADINETATDMLFTIMEQMKKAQSVTEELKAADQMAWVGAVNNIRACAEEVVLKELIYNCIVAIKDTTPKRVKSEKLLTRFFICKISKSDLTFRLLLWKQMRDIFGAIKIFWKQRDKHLCQRYPLWRAYFANCKHCANDCRIGVKTPPQNTVFCAISRGIFFLARQKTLPKHHEKDV